MEKPADELHFWFILFCKMSEEPYEQSVFQSSFYFKVIKQNVCSNVSLCSLHKAALETKRLSSTSIFFSGKTIVVNILVANKLKVLYSTD